MIITIDGKKCVCEPGEYILDIAKRNDIKIPTLCHHGGLTDQGCCRVCIVEVEINERCDIVTACIYPVEQDCTVLTDSERVTAQRGMILSLLKALAPESSEVSQLCEIYNAPVNERFTRKDGGKCILCGLCVEACESLGTSAIATMQRGIDKVVSTPYDEPSQVCVGCASCAMVCPTKAIDVKESYGERVIWNRSFLFKFCKKCGSKIGTLAELIRASHKINAEVPDLCENCRKKAITDAFAETYGF